MVSGRFCYQQSRVLFSALDTVVWVTQWILFCYYRRSHFARLGPPTGKKKTNYSTCITHTLYFKFWRQKYRQTQRERESQDSTYPRHRQQQLACDLTLQCHISVILTNTHKHTFNGPLPGTIRVSRYQKGKPVWILMKQETVSGSGISWAICKSAPRSRQITTPAPHHSVFYRPDALPTASKHSRHTNHQCITN